jgi:hypothetical protein
MILCWDGKRLTHARIEHLSQMPDPYDASSVPSCFPNDVRLLSRTKPTDFMQAGSFIFVSEQVKAHLKACRADVAFFPVPLVYKRDTLAGWYYLHLLKWVDCLDPIKAILAGSGSFPESVKRMVLIDSACAGVPMFRIWKTPQIGVSDELAATFRRAKCTGVLFVKPDEWRNPGLCFE